MLCRMSGGNSEREREDVVKEVASHGWYLARETKKGYYVMRCSCGNHQETLHKTPSDPNHFRNKKSRMLSQCSSQVQ